MGSPYLQTIKPLLLEVGKLCAERGVILPALLLAGVCAGACANAGSTPVFQERKKQRLLWRRETRVLKVTSGNNTLLAFKTRGDPFLYPGQRHLLEELGGHKSEIPTCTTPQSGRKVCFGG